jgi:serine/threonine-protein kinase
MKSGGRKQAVATCVASSMAIGKSAGALVLLGLVLVAAAAEDTSVSAATRRPVRFVQPTSIEAEPAGTLLLVENNPGRLLRVDPRNGRVTVIVPSISRPYAVIRTSTGRIYFSAANSLRRINPGRAPSTVTRTDSDIGPIAAAPDGTVYYSTGSHVYRLAAGASAPTVIASRERLAAPHGLAVAPDGALLLADTGNNRIVRIDPTGGTTTVLARVTGPRGLDVAPDGTVYVVDSGANRVLRLSASGSRRGYLAQTSGDLYDVKVARDGAVYVLEAGADGWVRRISRDGTVTTLSRP